MSQHYQKQKNLTVTTNPQESRNVSKPPQKPRNLKAVVAKHKQKGNSADAIRRLRMLISDLINEVEALDQKSLSLPDERLPENCDSINFYDEVGRFEIALIKSALRRTNGHQIQAAQLLNMNPSTLNAKIKQYNLRHSLGFPTF